MANENVVKGKAIEESGATVPYASVAVYSSEDSSLVNGTATDENGFFSISLEPGAYYLKISFLSFKEKTVPVIVKNEDIHLGNITLESSSITLKELEITTEKSQIQLQLDKRVFNVGKDLSNAGGNAAEVLDNVPSVTVDVDGNVNLRGSQNVRILIDGKPSGLVGMGSADALRLIQGNMIDRIEVITNPSARYDAEGEVGIINIILKKENRKGVNGSFDLTTGYPDNHGAAYNINYRKDFINLFSSYGVSYRQNPGFGFTNQTYSLNDTTYYFENNRTHSRGGLSHNFRIGSDFFLNDYNTITLSGLYKHSDGINNAQLIYKSFNENNELTQTVTRTEVEEELEDDAEFSLSYRKTFEQKDRVWTVDLKWIQSDDTELAEQEQESDETGSTTIFQRSSNTEDEVNYVLQTDYVHPFAKDGRFEAGLKSSLREIDNDFTVEQQENGEWAILSAYDNRMLYTENIHAAYAIIGNKNNQLSYQGGLRAEYSDITTELLETNDINPRKYFNLFPSVHLAYELDSSNTLQLSYSRRLSRPRFRELLPFFGFSDPRNFYSGNPDLNPEYTNSFELGHLKYWDKGSVLSSIYYRHRTGVVQRITVVDSVGYTSRFPVNLSTQNAVGLEFNITYDPAKWWRLSGNANFYRAITSGEFEGVSLYSDTYTWNARATSRTTILEKTDVQISFDFEAPQITTQGKDLSRSGLDIGISRDVLKGNGTLTLSGKDIFNSRKWRSVIDTEGFYSNSVFQWRSRQFLLTFNYRLHQQKKQNKSIVPSGGEDGY